MSPYHDLLTVLLLGIGSVGLLTFLLVFLTDIRREERKEEEEAKRERPPVGTTRRLFAALAVAMLIASVGIYADTPNSSCTEENIRAVCGDFWLVCYYSLGCYLLP